MILTPHFRKELLTKVVEMAETLANKSNYLGTNTTMSSYNGDLGIHFRYESVATGLSGIVWALQDASDVLQVNTYDPLINSTIYRLIEDYENRDNHNYGLFNGYGGLALTLMRSYNRNRDARLLHKAIQIGIESCDEFIDSSDIQNNYCHGRAGMLLAILYTFHVSGDQSLIGVIEKYVHKILVHAYFSGDVLHFDDPHVTKQDSLAFGRAGVGFVINQLARYFGNPSFQYVANRALMPITREGFAGSSWLTGSLGVLALRSMRRGDISSLPDFALSELGTKNQRVSGIIDNAGILSTMHCLGLDDDNSSSQLLAYIRNIKQFDGMAEGFHDGLAGVLHLVAKCLDKNILSPILPVIWGKAKDGFNLSTLVAKKLISHRFFSRSIFAMSENMGSTKAVNVVIRLSRSKNLDTIPRLSQQQKDVLTLDLLVLKTFWDSVLENYSKNAISKHGRVRYGDIAECKLHINPKLKLFVPRHTKASLLRLSEFSRPLNLEEEFSDAYILGAPVQSQTLCKNIGLLIIVLQPFMKPMYIKEVVRAVTTTLLSQHNKTREQLNYLCELQPQEKLHLLLPKVIENIIMEFVNLSYIQPASSNYMCRRNRKR